MILSKVLYKLIDFVHKKQSANQDLFAWHIWFVFQKYEGHLWLKIIKLLVLD